MTIDNCFLVYLRGCLHDDLCCCYVDFLARGREGGADSGGQCVEGAEQIFSTVLEDFLLVICKLLLIICCLLVNHWQVISICQIINIING